MKQANLVKITRQDLKFIVKDKFAAIEDTAKFNAYCRNCSNKREYEMTNYDIYIDGLNDIVFKGMCNSCEEKMVRHIEIGEDKKYFMKTQYIKEKRSKEG